ncbi:secretion protein HlyD family protein [Burkholderia ambifaria MEX-5]|uniref:Secretion protein HlyD family protein n=1 Tax=Burkholderia ambifaria MEX-5 TaxID=396597 RepID=B1TCP3_9BURK|nr:secretion protein HlyD family protein [Burkholderia ambifaria MEX-5]
MIIVGAVAVVLVIAGIVWWLATRNQESTDDAYTDGNAVAVAPHVSGYVTRLAVDDNTYVHRGDVLVEIDPRDYRAQVDAARVQLGLAQAQLDASRVQLDIAHVQFPAQYRQARAQIESAEAAYRQALAAQERQRAVDARATSQQAIDAADAQRASADANVAMAQAQARTASLVPQQIRQAETALAYRRAVLVALRDVDNALAVYRTDQARAAALDDAVKAEQGALELARDRYRKGLSPFLDVLDAERQWSQGRQQAVEGALQTTTDLVALYKALGGGWQTTGPAAGAVTVGAAPPSRADTTRAQ